MDIESLRKAYPKFPKLSEYILLSLPDSLVAAIALADGSTKWSDDEFRSWLNSTYLPEMHQLEEDYKSAK